MGTMTTQVVGMRWYRAVRYTMALGARTQIRLVREPNNPHDCNAIECYHHKKKLGYVPRVDAVYLAPIMDSGIPVAAEIHMMSPLIKIVWDGPTLKQLQKLRGKVLTRTVELVVGNVVEGDYVGIPSRQGGRGALDGVPDFDDGDPWGNS